MPRQPTAKASAIREPLTFALGSRAKVGCLRVLSLTAEPVTQRELARRCRLQHRTVQLALEEIISLGLVTRVQGGRDYMVQLNRDHQLAPAISALFSNEGTYFSLLRREVRNALLGDWIEDLPSSVVAFGSAARADDVPGSDLDLLIVASSVARAEEFLTRIEGKRRDLERLFGVQIRPIGYSTRQARALWRAGRAPIKGAYRDGIVLHGKPLSDILA